MRKFTLLIASLFFAIGTMAQTATTYADGVYKIFWQYDQRGYLTYHADYPNDPQLAGVVNHNPNGHYQLTDEGIQLSWYLYTSATTSKSYLFEATTGKFITIDMNTTSGNGKRCALSEEVSEFAQFDLKATTNTTAYMLSYGSYNFCSGCGTNKGAGPVRFATDGQTDGGIPFVFVTDGASITDEVKNAAIAKITEFESKVEETLTYTLTDIAGNEFTGTYEGYVGESLPTFTGATGYSLTNGVWDGTNYTATINFAYPVSNKDNGVTNETMFNVKNHNAKLLRVVDNAVKVTNETADANCLWAIYPVFNNGAFTFTIMNVATGKYIYSEASGSMHDTSGNNNTGADGVFALSETASVFTYELSGSYYGFKFADGRSTTFISINSPANDTNVDLGIHTSAHAGTEFVAQSVSAYPVAITEAKYATFYAPVAVTVPSGVTAHTVTINGDWATLSDPLAIIPAYTGVVLYSETAQTYTFNVTTTDVTVENNALLGTVAATYITADAYVLGIDNGEVGFYKAVTSGQADGTFLNNHHKAYLPKTAGMNIASYSFRFGEGTTGIDEITDNRVQSTVIYDLTGRRVETITEPGIYIVNGVKKLVR